MRAFWGTALVFLAALGLSACSVDANNLTAVKSGISEKTDPSSGARLIVGPKASAGQVRGYTIMTFEGTLVVRRDTGEPIELRLRVGGGANDTIGTYSSSVPIARFERYLVPVQSITMLGTTPIVHHGTLYGADLTFEPETFAQLRKEGLAFRYRSAANNRDFAFQMPAAYVNALFERL